MQRIIKTQEATIKTATVDIQTLRIGAKQMTLGVFRQLMSEDILDINTGELRGVPWGLVNYFWTGCHWRDDDSHLHVVWQKAEELRRGCVFKERLYPSERQRQSAELKAAYMKASMWARIHILLSILEGKRIDILLPPKPNDDDAEAEAELAIPLEDGANYPLAFPLVVRLKDSYDTLDLMDFIDLERKRRFSGFRDEPSAFEEQWRKEASDWVRSIAIEYRLVFDVDAAAALQNAVAITRASVAKRDKIKEIDTRYARHYAEIATLDQLFIAV